MADSKPEENANAPMGNIESPNCSIRERNAALPDASAPSFMMVMRGTGRCLRCLSMRFRVCVDTPGRVSVYVPVRWFDISVTLVRVRMHGSFRATEQPPRLMWSEIGNNGSAGHELVANTFKTMCIHDG